MSHSGAKADRGDKFITCIFTMGKEDSNDVPIWNKVEWKNTYLMPIQMVKIECLIKPFL